jgi:hypothetical protein
VIYLYYALAVPTAVLAGLLLLLTLAGRSISPGTPWWLSVSVGAAVLGLLYWGYSLGRTRGRPGAAVLLVLGSWLLFFVVMLTHGLLRQQTWQ